jgi:IS30 family transposase
MSKLTTEESSRIRALLLAGMSHNAIAKQVGRAQSTVSAFAQREGIAPVNQAPVSAIERRKVVLSLEARLEATGELMVKVREIAEQATTGREIKECSVAWGVLCDKSTIMEGLPSSRTETHTSSMRAGSPVLNLEEEFRALDDRLEAEARVQEAEQGKEYGAGERTID